LWHLERATDRGIVGARGARAAHSLVLRDVNWLGDGALCELPAEGLPVFAKVRSTRPPVEAVLRVVDGAQGTEVRVDLVGGESGVAPGQACGLYADDSADARVLGGGFLQRPARAAEPEAMLPPLIAPPAVAAGEGAREEVRG